METKEKKKIVPITQMFNNWDSGGSGQPWCYKCNRYPCACPHPKKEEEVG